ncbi:MAG: tRNA pseudouridine(38-40) synthase TruA [Acutalibacteraceae bacterium]
MRNLLFKISFDGAAFHGWQQQENARTVQGELKNAFKRLTGEDVNIIGCSRTDAGVHANEYYFNVRTASSIPCERFPVALSSAKLTDEIAIWSCKEVDYDFNARFDCVKKEYVYIIENTEIHSPFMCKRALNYKYPLNAELMNSASKAFIGTYDFSAFCAADAQVKTKVRTIYDAEVFRDGDLVKFRVCGNGFLYNMVRIMVGTLLNVSMGKINLEDIPAVIESKNRKRAGFTAEPCGLYLNKVYYGGERLED